jgi:hypothetical protein
MRPALGCEGIVSQRLGSPYRAGRSPHWLKIKNPEALAMRRASPFEAQFIYFGPVQLTKSIAYPHLFPPYVLYRDTVKLAQ